MGCPVTATGKLPCFAGWDLNSASPSLPVPVVVPKAKHTWLLEELEEPRTAWTVGAVMGQHWESRLGLAARRLLDPAGARQLLNMGELPLGTVPLCLPSPYRLCLLLEPYQGARTGKKGFLVGHANCQASLTLACWAESLRSALAFLTKSHGLPTFP